MHAIARFFLRAKHWQIFLLLFVINLLGNVALIVSMLTTTQPSQDLWNSGSSLFAVFTLLFVFCFLGWFWSMGSFLDSIVQPELRLKMKIFRVAVIYPMCYLPFFLAFFLSLSILPMLFVVIFPLHFLAMSCMFYLLYFVSKSLVLAETGKAASFYDYAGPFFLLWFFPIGVWFTQPRINRLYADTTNSKS
jgi:hypothetical protein